MESQLNAVEAQMKGAAEKGDTGGAAALGMASVGISAARAALRALPAALEAGEEWNGYSAISVGGETYVHISAVEGTIDAFRAMSARIAELEAERPTLIAAAPDWTEAARHMLETFDVWFRGDARDQSEAAHRLILAGSFAAQAFEDLAACGATADGAPVGMMRTFLLALIDPALPELDPLRARNRTPADALSQPAEGGEGGAV
ncbi:hypothetical protein [Pseudogemmobacter faecipullorum]|uniref:Uncharacterized protein n=1 Tax=Pseudogemmobacter faecipullorum TaxID=2755041 RepID=A0ABS8CRY6_9RHOB|nr:hypothetical protein [Pseudogemmobacter faecipullorum]MCB5412158.1 hypothetical protein [Pseudogemmobacter faecipullorum]